MNILHLTAASSNSGAGKAAVLTHKALLDFENVSSRILFLKKENNLEENFIYYSSTSLYNKFRRLAISTLDRLPLVFYRKKKPHLFSTGQFGISFSELEIFKWADVIHIHWANHGMIDISHISKWGKPVVWTLRDMWAFTGGCHYSLDCLNYETSCKRCFLLGSYSNFDLSTYCFNRKLKIFQDSNIFWVSISSWIQKIAKNSSILSNFESPIIFSGIRTDIFIPHSRLEVKRQFGIPANAIVVLIGSATLSDEYKGGKYIIDVLERFTEDIYLVSFGLTNSLSFVNKKIKYLNLGYVSDDKKLAKIYSTADVFFAPSINEAFGKTVAEAQSCGIPVLCFSETGPADIVEHLITGYQAEYKDIQDLINGLKFCINHQFNRTYIRKRAIDLFDIKISAEKYFNLYLNLYNNFYCS